MQHFAALQRLSTCFNGSLLIYSDIKKSIALITGGGNFKNVTDFDQQIVYTGVIDPAEFKSAVIFESTPVISANSFKNWANPPKKTSESYRQSNTLLCPILVDRRTQSMSSLRLPR